jgi:hypothetical protein
MIPQVTIPDPLELKPGLTDADLVYMLDDTFAKVRAVRFPMHRFQNRIAKPEVLVMAGRVLTFLELPPMVWVLSSFDAYAEMGHSKGAPTMAWVYSEKRIEGHAKRIKQEYDLGLYRGGRVMYVRGHLELASRWQEMKEELLREKPDNLPSLVAVVNRHFVLGEFERVVEQCIAVAARERARLMGELRDGKCLWGVR